MSVLGRVQAWHTPRRADIEAAPTPIRPVPGLRARPTGWGTGIQRLAPFDFTPPGGLWDRQAAMTVPTISRSRDLICGAVGALPLVLYTVDWANPGAPVELSLPPATWMARPDPTKTRNFMLAWTVDDLFFYGRGYWLVVDRYAPPQSYPRSFVWMPTVQVRVDTNGDTWWDGVPVNPADVIEFLSPIEGLLDVGWRAVNTAVQLDQAAERFSRCEVPAGWLKQTDGEPMTGEELSQLAADFASLRMTLSIAALNSVTDYHESSLDPSKLQLTEARQHQALELARITNIPPSLVGAPSGTGMTYNNTLQAKQDLIDFGAAPYINCVEQTLGGPNVVPAGQFVRLDLNAWLRNPYVTAPPAPNDMQTAFNPPTPAPAPVPLGVTP